MIWHCDFKHDRSEMAVSYRVRFTTPRATCTSFENCRMEILTRNRCLYVVHVAMISSCFSMACLYFSIFPIYDMQYTSLGLELCYLFLLVIKLEYNKASKSSTLFYFHQNVINVL